MARAALGWSLTDLAVGAGLGRATVARFELGEAVADTSVSAMSAALEAAGVDLIPAGAIMKPGQGSGGAGVRLRNGEGEGLHRPAEFQKSIG